MISDLKIVWSVGTGLHCEDGQAGTCGTGVIAGLLDLGDRFWVRVLGALCACPGGWVGAAKWVDLLRFAPEVAPGPPVVLCWAGTLAKHPSWKVVPLARSGGEGGRGRAAGSAAGVGSWRVAICL